MSTRRFLLPLYLLTLSGTLVSSELVLESGYYVSTVLDFNKPLPSGGINGHGVHPFALHPLNRSPNLLLLDSTNSSFYSLELPVSQESVLRLLSGKRTAGFDDGDAISAMFNRPRSFTVDNNDNVYVADRINHVIRKINGFSGLTTTIAGGYSKKAGHTDGPAQNATFSEDFDIIFMRKMCSLLISDRGSRMIRQMNLKPEDCEEKPISSQGLGAIPVSAIAVLALLCGLALGFMGRPFVISSSSTGSLHEPLHPPLMESYPNNSEETSTDVLLRHQKHFVSRNQTLKLQQFTDEMKDLMYFEEENSVLDLSSSANQVETEEASGRNLHEAEDESNLNGKIDNMLVTNLLDFTASSKEQSLVKRRRNGVHDLSI